MSRTSSEFGEKLRQFLRKNRLTLRDAAFATGLSATYWKNLTDGRIPSARAIDRIADTFPELDANELRVLAGYATKPDLDPATAVMLTLRTNSGISDEGINQIVDFVREIEEKYGKKR